MSCAVVVGIAALLLVQTVGAAGRWPRITTLPRPALAGWTRPGAVAVVWGLATAPVFARLDDPAALVMGANDQSAHVGWGADVELWPPSFPQPQIVFLLLVRLATIPFGRSSAGEAGVVVLVALSAWGGWCAQRFAASIGSRVGESAAAATAAILLFTETPWVLARRTTQLDAGDGALVLHLWATPSNALLLPMAVMLTGGCLHVLDRPGTRSGLVLGALVVVSMLAKPNAALVLVPAAIVMAAARRRESLATLLVGGLIPMVVVGVAQVRLLETTTGFERTGLRIAPLDQWRTSGADDPRFWLIVVPMAMLAAACWRAVRADRAVHLAAIAALVGVVQLLLLGETGFRADHANWAIGLHIAAVVLWLAVARHGVELLTSSMGGRARRVAVALAIGLGLVSGVGAWAVAVGASLS